MNRPVNLTPSARIVEVQVANVRVGSGYLLTDRLVLTAYHVIAMDGPIRVRPVDALRSAPVAASRLWPVTAVDDRAHPEQDVALLLVDAPAEWPQGPLPGGAVRFGEVTGEDRVSCYALGFPDAERRPDGDRDVMRLPGSVEPVQGTRFGLLTLYSELLLRSVDGGSPWKGMSGGPLFTADGLLLGVLVEDRNTALNRTMLRAASLSRMLELPGFRDVLVAHGVAPRISHELLELYLEAAVQEANDQPYAGVIGGRKPRLQEVHLRQQVRCLKEEADRPADGGRPPLVSPAVLLPADDILAAGTTCVVLAGPGGGKSSLLRTWLIDAVALCKAGASGVPVPVLVPAKALIGDDGKLTTGGDFPAALARAVVGEVWLDLNRLFAGPPPGGGAWLVLVDGLDEIPSARTRIRLLRHLALLARQDGAGPYRFVVATRPLPDGELDQLGQQIARFDLLPFDRDELLKVACGWFTALGVADPSGTARRFVTEALARDPLPELARTPLMAGLLCQLYARNPEGPLPIGRGEIYDEFVELLRKHQAEQGAGDVWEEALDLAGYIASRRLAGGKKPLDELLESWPGQLPAGMTPKDTVLRSGLLTDRAGELGFLQQTFLEYCAARYATRTPEESGREVRRLFGDAWRRQRPTRTVHVAWWGRHCWIPPDQDKMSYTGFLLDRLLDERRKDPVAAETGRELLRLTGRLNLTGCCFLAQQKRLGTALPEAVVEAAVESLRRMARITDEDRRNAHLRANPDQLHPEVDPALAAAYLSKAQRNSRVDAAVALWQLGDASAADILAEIVETPYLTTSMWRAYAAAGLCDMEDERGIRLLRVLADNSWNHNETRIEAATALVFYGDERGVQLLDGFARDTRGFLLHERANALKALALLGHEHSADVVDCFARDPGAPPALRNWSAQMLACAGDDRGPALLDALAHDAAQKSRLRLLAAQALAKHDRERGAVALAELTGDRSVKRRHRRRALKELASAERGDE